MWHQPQRRACTVGDEMPSCIVIGCGDELWPVGNHGTQGFGGQGAKTSAGRNVCGVLGPALDRGEA